MDECRAYSLLADKKDTNMITATNELSVVNRKSTARVARHTDAVLPQIELVTLFSTRYTANRYDTTPSTSSSSSLLI